MSIQDAYRRVDQALAARGITSSYVLIPEHRLGEVVLDFVLPLETTERDQVVAVLSEGLGPQRGRDRLAAIQFDLKKHALEADRRHAA